MPRRAQGVVGSHVVVQLIVVAPGEKPRHAQTFQLPEAVGQKLGAAPVRVVMPGVAGHREQVRLEPLDQPLQVRDGAFVRTGAVLVPATKEVEVGELQQAYLGRVPHPQGG